MEEHSKGNDSQEVVTVLEKTRDQARHSSQCLAELIDWLYFGDICGEVEKSSMLSSQTQKEIRNIKEEEKNHQGDKTTGNYLGSMI